MDERTRVAGRTGITYPHGRVYDGGQFASRTSSASLPPSAIFDLVVIELPEELDRFRTGLTDEAREAMADCHETLVTAPDLHDLLGEVIECLRAQLS